MKNSNINLYEIKKGKTEFPKMKCTSSNDAYQYLKQFYSDDIEIYESSFIIMLNRANVIIAYAKISQGGIIGTVIDPKIVGYYAMQSLASGIIIVHNHPSGNLQPSQADDNITQKLKNTLLIIETQLLDHLIITKDGYYSYADEGKI